MRIVKVVIKIFGFSLFIVSSMTANVYAGNVNALFGFGFDFGGDTIDSFQSGSGDTETIKANEGIYIYGGVIYNLNEKLEVQTTIGYKFESLNATNGDVRFDRAPLELLLFTRKDQHRFGGGVTYHTGVEYECELTGSCNFTVDLDDALGFIIEYDYLLSSKNFKYDFSLGVRYTNIEYEVDPFNFTIDANGLGINTQIFF